MMIQKNDIETMRIQCSQNDEVIFSLEANQNGKIDILRKKENRNEKISEIKNIFFNKLLEHVDENLINRPGKKYVMPKITGDKMDILISFSSKDKDNTFQFVYGSKSNPPPREIVEIVKSAIELGDEVFNNYQGH
jgi:hypothetical protein